MSNERDLTFAPLTDGNYVEWEVQMEVDLVDKGLWEYIFEDVVKPEGDTAANKKAIVEFEMKQRQARARMIKRVTVGQLPHMRNANLKMIWAELKCIHCGGGFRL